MAIGVQCEGCRTFIGTDVDKDGTSIMPFGWYLVQRFLGEEIQVSVFCSVTCLSLAASLQILREQTPVRIEIGIDENMDDALARELARRKENQSW